MKPFSFAAVKNDALLAAAGESDGYMLPQGTCDEAVLALVEAVEAAHENAERHNPISYKLRHALDRFDFGAGS